MIPVEKILDEIIEQAKDGSCKTCRWCGVHSKQSQWEYEGHTHTHFCMIQGNFNGIDFAQCHLDSTAYPWKCDEGAWNTTDGAIPGCLAYQPGYEGVKIDAPGYHEAAWKHMDFMRALAEAIHIHNAIQNNDLAKLTAKLNEAKESLPVKV